MEPPTVVLVIGLHQTVHIHPELPDPPQLLYLLGCKEKLGHVSEVLAHGPQGLAGVDVGLVPPEKLLGSRNIFGNGLLRQYMLSGLEGFTDKVRLD